MKKTKLGLSKETIRNLKPDELDRVAGGAYTMWCTYNCTQIGCPPPRTPGCPM